MRFFVIVAFLLQFSISGYSQYSDSFARRIDSSLKARNKMIRAFQDSLDRLEIKRSMEQNGKNLDRFMADYQERQKKERKQMYIRLGLGVAFLAVLIVAIVRRRKMKNKQ